MATTFISDLYTPEVWNPMMDQDFIDRAAIAQSGVLARDSRYDEAVSGRAAKVSIPYLNPMTDDMEVLTEDTALTLRGVTGGDMTAYKLIRGIALTASDLASAVTGDDIVGYIRSKVGGYIARQRQKALISSLTGIFATALSANENDISAAATTGAIITADSFADTSALLGENLQDVAAIAMHSAVFNKLRKDGVITSNEGAISSNVQLAQPDLYLNNARVIIDDNCPVAGGVYTSYLFAVGSIAYGSGQPTGMPLLEDYRDELKSAGGVIVRDAAILHPQGMSFTGSPAGITPTNTELATGGNWTLEYSQKNVKIASLKGKLVANA